MKKYVIMSLALLIGSFSFAQKKELKEAEKAIKSNDFASAKSAIKSAEGMLSAMDDKTKAKFYFLKGQALYANGAGNNDEVNESLESFKMLKETEEQSGKKIYTPKAEGLTITMSNGFIDKAQNALNRKDHETAYRNFEAAYKTSPNDTLYLYNAAILAGSSKNYDAALKMYDELTTLGYTGITVNYKATNIETGEEEIFPNSGLRDISIKGGTHEKSRNEKTKSKVGDIAKNIALIYIEKGETDKALTAIDNAKKTSPNDYNLILAEANVRYKLGQTDNYKKLISEALALEPNNVDLLFNLGVVAANQKKFEEAKSYYDKAIKMDPTYKKAYMNMAALILEGEQGIIDEMNALGTSAADNKKYDELLEKRLQLFRDAVPYLTASLENDSKNISAAKTLQNIYSELGDDANFKVMKAKVEALESGN